MLSKTLENIFKVFDDQGPKVFTEISEMYAEIWELYYVSMLILPCALLFYAFWAGGFFGGPGERVNHSPNRPQNMLAKFDLAVSNCCRCLCCCHEWLDFGGAELCFWSLILFLQLTVLLLFIMAILISIIAAVQFFLASGCAEIYLLGDASICGNVLLSLRTFLDTFMPSVEVTNFAQHCVSQQLLTCDLIGAKMKAAAECTVLGSFLAATFTLQLIIESGTLHTRACTRIKFEHTWQKRHGSKWELEK